MARLAAVAAVALAVVAALLFAPIGVRSYQCDGVVPTWMVQAQDPPYDGGGCVEILADSERPYGADDTPYCLGLCIGTEARPDYGR